MHAEATANKGEDMPRHVFLFSSACKKNVPLWQSREEHPGAVAHVRSLYPLRA